MTQKDPQLQALEARLFQFEQVMYNHLQRPGVMEELSGTIKTLSTQMKLAASPETKITIPAGRVTTMLQMLGVAMERMNLLRFQDLAQKEKENVTEQPQHKQTSQKTN